MNDDRITYDQLSQLIDGRDRPAAHAIDNAARGVNATERTIRQITGMIRAKLDRDRAAARPRPEPERTRRTPAHARRPRPGDHAPAGPLAGARRPAHRDRDDVPPARAAAPAQEASTR